MYVENFERINANMNKMFTELCEIKSFLKEDRLSSQKIEWIVEENKYLKNLRKISEIIESEIECEIIAESKVGQDNQSEIGTNILVKGGQKVNNVGTLWLYRG